MTVGADNVVNTVSPEDLARCEVTAGHRVPALRTLDEVRVALDRTGLMWGPTGSVGFELATGVSTATDASDLDLLMRLPHVGPDVLAQLTHLHRLFMEQPAHIDCQIETVWGAAALAELIADQPEILMRTGTGPRLVSRAVTVP